MTYVLAAPMFVAALALAYARRRHRAEAATILIVALPIVASIPHTAPSWYESLRTNYRLDPAVAVAIAPPVMARERNLALARQALTSIAADETYGVVPHLRRPRRSASARLERARLTYLESWLQYWLAPRIQVDPSDAAWLILLDAADLPPPAGPTAVYRFGNDFLVRR